MNKVNPPFRADHVGSLLRPRKLLDARDQFFSGNLPADELRAGQGAAAGAVDQQRAVGVDALKDALGDGQVVERDVGLAAADDGHGGSSLGTA